MRIKKLNEKKPAQREEKTYIPAIQCDRKKKKKTLKVEKGSSKIQHAHIHKTKQLFFRE